MSDPKASSRIFVRGLPPSLSEDDFKKHFSALYMITDARLIPHRRIGYVGYKTSQEATKAVRHFNKSFIRMSKIAVELAKPVPRAAREKQSRIPSDEQDRDTGPSPVAGELHESRGLKRKRDAQDIEAREHKIQEFLGSKQPTSKASRLTSASEPEIASKDQGLDKTEPTTAKSDLYQERYQPSQSLDQAEGESSHIKEVQHSSGHAVDLDDILSSTENAPKEKASRPADIEGGRNDDADWLRNRTNRVLDLVDEDVDQLPHPPDAGALAGGDMTSTQTSERRDGEAEQDGDILQDSEELHAKQVGGSGDTDVDAIMSTGRLFVRNIAYDTSAIDIRTLFQSYGEIEEVHVPIGFESGSNKGYAYVSFETPSCAVQAFRDLDGTIYQGRLIHLLPSIAKRTNGLDDFAISKLPLKKQKQIRRKAEAASSSFNWNTLYMNADAVISSVSDRLGVSKSTLLDPTSSDAAVKQAHAETHVIQETKSYFAEQGVNLDAFRSRERGDTAVLAKNFPYEMKSGELRKLFEEYGEVVRFLIPPTGTIAIIEYAKAQHARNAFGSLAYRRVRDSVLFLEKAPKHLFQSDSSDVIRPSSRFPSFKPSTSDLLQGEAPNSTLETSTLFIRNLSFDTSNERLNQVFNPLDGFLSARIKTKTDPKRPGQTLSMGFGFVEFVNSAQAQAALVVMDGYQLDGHTLQIKTSHKGLDAATQQRKENRARRAMNRSTKIIIKNLPFEATKKEVRSLFGAYGQLRSVRVPKKFDRARGFAFAQFTTPQEAESAMDSLRNTHLLGRRLVLEFASDDPENAEAEIEKMQQKVGSQVHKVALQNLTGQSRKKFTINDEEEDNDQAQLADAKSLPGL